MKIEIKSEMAQVNLEMEPVKVFQLIQDALRYAAAMPKVEEPKKDVYGGAVGLRDFLGVDGVCNHDVGAKGDRGVTLAKDNYELLPKIRAEHKHLYKGFLYTKCEKCGGERGWHAKYGADFFRCKCGHETPLEDLKPLHLRCGCGKSFTYRTNMQEDSFQMACIECGKLNTLVLNASKTAYVPMGTIKW